jgi:hypothetical protein
MAAAIEGRIQPNLHKAIDETIAQHIAGKTEYIQIIVATAQFGRNVVVTRRGTDARNLVGGNAHSKTGTAYQDSTVDLARRDLSAHRRRDVRIVDRIRSVTANVEDFLAETSEQLNEFCSHLQTSMITSNRNPHWFASWYWGERTSRREMPRPVCAVKQFQNDHRSS